MEDVVQPSAAPGSVLYMERYTGYMRMISMWPRGSVSFIRYWAVFLIWLASTVFMLYGFVDKLIYHASDVGGIAGEVDFLTLYISTIFRLIYSYIYGSKYVEIADYIHNNFTYSSFGPVEKQKMDKYVKIAKIISHSLIILTFLWVLQITTVPFLTYSVQMNMRYENGTPMYPNARPTMMLDVALPTDYYHYGISHMIQILSYFAVACIYVFSESFLFVAMILTTGQFELINHSLKNIADPKASDEEEEKQSEQVLTSCVIHYRLMRELVHNMDDLFNPMMLVDFLHAIVSISFLLLDLTVALDDADWIGVANNSQFLFLSVFLMLTFDYLGNELYLKEYEISQTIYSIPWYKYPKTVKTQVVVMTTLARKPYRLTRGKLFDVSLEFFMGTMKTVYSYFMFLIQLRDEPQRSPTSVQSNQ